MVAVHIPVDDFNLLFSSVDVMFYISFVFQGTDVMLERY